MGLKKVADNPYPQLRGKVWTYYRRVPTHMVPALGRVFIKQSLGTADITESRRLRNIKTVRVDALFAELEPPDGRLERRPPFTPGKQAQR
jgi:hypothetical protein